MLTPNLKNIKYTDITLYVNGQPIVCKKDAIIVCVPFNEKQKKLK